MRSSTAAITMMGIALALLSCGGCGAKPAGPQSAPTVPVKGKITYQGQPLTRGSITLEPVDSGRDAHGSIQPDGTFVLTTFQEGDGAVVGAHRVAVTGTGPSGRELVPLKFRHPSSSKVEVEVSAGKTDYTIDLK